MPQKGVGSHFPTAEAGTALPCLRGRVFSEMTPDPFFAARK
jgi:hypothetical protein